MWVVSLIAILALVFSFVGGLKEGVVKSFTTLVVVLIALPLTGLSYHLLAGVLSFLPGNWPNLAGFLITWGVISAILQLIFLAPRKALQIAWGGGLPFRPIGGLLSTLAAAIGLVALTMVFLAYPIWDWLEQAVINSGVLAWLVTHLGFVQSLLPDELGQEAIFAKLWLLLHV